MITSKIGNTKRTLPLTLLSAALILGAQGQTSAQGSRTLNVPADFETIQAALDAAERGDTVLAHPGKYRETLVLPDGVHLRGTDRDEVVIEMPKGHAPALLVAHEVADASVANLTFDGRGYEAEKVRAFGVKTEMRDGELWISGMAKLSPLREAGVKGDVRVVRINGEPPESPAGLSRFAFAASSVETWTLKLRGDEFQGVIEIEPAALTVAAPPHPGGLVLANSQVRINHCVVESFNGPGINGFGQLTEATLHDNTAEDNPIGILFERGAGGMAQDNTASRNKRAGIMVRGMGTSPTLHGNTAEDNPIGILFGNAAGGVAQDNTASGNKKAGIMVLGKGTSPTLHGNTAEDNQYGILFGNAAGGVAQDNTASGNKIAGIEVRGKGTSPTLHGNTAEDNPFGIAFARGAGGVAQDNTASGNKKVGIEVGGKGTSPTLHGNTAEDNQYGIFFVEGAGGLALDNNAKENGAVGILVTGKGTSPTLRGNTATDNGNSEIKIGDGAAPKVGPNNTGLKE